MAEPSPTTGFQLRALRRFGRNVGIFWKMICFAGVVLAVVGVWVQNPRFFTTPRGWLALTLVACYLTAYSVGTRWISGRDLDSYWKERFNTGATLYPWRAVTLWATLLALSIGLIALNENFIWVIWVPFGMSLSMLPMPQTLLLAVPTALLAMVYYGQFPTSMTPPELLKFAGVALGFSCYSVVIYLPIVLLRHRFQRERMFLQLERSHHDLEQAHRQLAQAAEHERELAVLRERGRLARDMHDTLGHSLALMTVKLEAAQRLRDVDAARADHEVAATQAIARGALAELRAAIADLRTSGSARECLGDALTHAAEESAARAGWRLTREIDPGTDPADIATYEALLRTGIESLANIERHARAGAVGMALKRDGETVVLRIEDDGVGILTTNPPQRIEASVANGATLERDASISDATEVPSEIVSPAGHFGITGMRERVTGSGGAFAIGAGIDGHGTRVEVRLPATTG